MNVVIKSSAWLESDIEILFGDEEVIFEEATDLPGLLAKLGIYQSSSKARQAGRTGLIASGWTDNFKASKKVPLWIWNPSDET